jgi:polyisoprenoid-binding protein YceI
METLMPRLLPALMACALPAFALAAPETYVIDPVHSYPNFTINHIGMTNIHGRFDKMSGTIVLDRAARTGQIEVKIETASVTTGDLKHEPGSYALKNYGPRSRDDHLRTADFFNVAEFPEATYKSSKFNFNGDTLESIDGTLTLLGVSKPVKLAVSSFKCQVNPYVKKDMCGAEATTQFKRSDFGMKTFVGPISDEVKMSFGIEAYKE